jgi:CRISPR-associated protein Csm4
VVGDTLPAGFLPRPTMPLERLGFDTADPAERKMLKGKQWLPPAVLKQPLHRWSEAVLSEGEMLAAMGLEGRFCRPGSQSHNSLDRRTGTAEGFAPFQRHLLWYHPEVRLNIEVELDEHRLSLDELKQTFEWIGASGFGKEANCGLGEFHVCSMDARPPAGPAGANALLTLASCALQALGGLSKALPETVQQGYAPVFHIRLDPQEES